MSKPYYILTLNFFGRGFFVFSPYVELTVCIVDYNENILCKKIHTMVKKCSDKQNKIYSNLFFKASEPD